MNKPPVLFINGQGDGKPRLREGLVLSHLWARSYHMWHAHVNWYSDATFVEHLDRTTDLARGLLQAKGSLAIVGDSMAFNVFGKLPAKNRDLQAISLCGRLAEGNLSNLDHRKLESTAHLETDYPSQSYYDSVIYCEQETLPYLTAEQRRRLYVVHQLADFKVPHQTMLVDGVANHRLPVIGHAAGILLGGMQLPGIIQRQSLVAQF